MYAQLMVMRLREVPISAHFVDASSVEAEIRERGAFVDVFARRIEAAAEFAQLAEGRRPLR